MPRRMVVVLTVAAALSCRTANAQESRAPTFSLEAVAVEGSLLPEPTSSVRIGPGERILAKVFLRDWSPNGERLRGYQAELDSSDFDSGEKGTVKPVNHDEKRAAGEQNTGAAYIDDQDPQYVYSGLHIIPIVDTVRAPGYRWLTVLLNPMEEAPAAPQDGTKFYLGTLELEASPDAEGTFTIGFAEGPETTGLLDLDSQYITGIAYEPLTVIVDPQLIRLMIRESRPPDGAIDARLPVPYGAEASSPPWSEVAIRFSLDASGVTVDDFSVTDGTSSPPSVTSVDTEGTWATVRLSSPIQPGRWTDVTYTPTGVRVRLGYLPGDVNNDGRTDSADVLKLVEALNGEVSLAKHQTDLDRDGETTPADLVALVELISDLRKRGGARLAVR